MKVSYTVNYNGKECSGFTKFLVAAGFLAFLGCIGYVFLAGLISILQ